MKRPKAMAKRFADDKDVETIVGRMYWRRVAPTPGEREWPSHVAKLDGDRAAALQDLQHALINLSANLCSAFETTPDPLGKCSPARRPDRKGPLPCLNSGTRPRPRICSSGGDAAYGGLSLLA